MQKNKIITLLEQDIKHNKLLNGLDSIGLNDNDRYTLSIDLMVADIMGYPQGKIPDRWLETYHKEMLSIPNNLSAEETTERASNLYNALSSI